MVERIGRDRIKGEEKQMTNRDERVVECHKPSVIPFFVEICAGGAGWDLAPLFVAPMSFVTLVIPVVTFLTPLAECFSDLKDR